MGNIKNNKSNPGQFKDVSRFTRWVNRMDEKDKSLNPVRRKSKWVITVILLFFLFGLSFIWFPTAKINTEKMIAPVAAQPLIQNQQPASIFEMPVDSFEQHLKQKVYEELPKEK
ncbi:hypothetical protein KAH94_05965 [bacterium]|nr:hypothetical protein [bacterium]